MAPSDRAMFGHLLATMTPRSRGWLGIKPHVELLNSIIASVAILAAGGWALFTYVVNREGVWNVEMSVASDEVPYQDRRSLLVLRVNLLNLGRRNVRPDSNGLRLSVTRLPTDIPASSVVWRNGDEIEGGETVLHDYNMLRHYGWGYEIEPGAHYEETEAIVVDSASTFLVTLKLFGPDHDYITQYAFVHADPAAAAAPDKPSTPTRKK